MKVTKEISYIADIPVSGCQPIRIRTYSGDCEIAITTVGTESGFYRRFQSAEDMYLAIKEMRQFLETIEGELNEQATNQES